MIPELQLALEALKSTADAVAEVARFLETAEGQQSLKQARGDWSKFEQVFAQLGTSIRSGLTDLGSWFRSIDKDKETH